MTMLCSLKAYGPKKYIFLKVYDKTFDLVSHLPHLDNFKMTFEFKEN